MSLSLSTLSLVTSPLRNTLVASSLVSLLFLMFVQGVFSVFKLRLMAISFRSLNGFAVGCIGWPAAILCDIWRGENELRCWGRIWFATSLPTIDGANIQTARDRML